eukprot:m.76502 g.76502  ORF g.76502 m.76502 type:complete len:156 (-) comp8516_c1_seq9:457-924(-)
MGCSLQRRAFMQEGPILLHNIREYIDQFLNRDYDPSLKTFTPQDDFLKLLILGNGSAIGAKWGIAFHGQWVWKLKDYIDRAWMYLFGHEHPYPDELKKEGQEKSRPPTVDEAVSILLNSESEDYKSPLVVLDAMRDDEELRKAVIEKMRTFPNKQ